MLGALKLVTAGVAIGLLVAAALGRFLVALLHGVSALDPLVFAAVTLIIVVAAALAAYLPALRAARVSPTGALRFE